MADRSNFDSFAVNNGIGLNPLSPDNLSNQSAGAMTGNTQQFNNYAQSTPVGNPTPQAGDEFDIFKAAKSGLLISCQDIVERLGVDELTKTDSDGATPIHWASLGGHVHVLRFFAECRVPLDVRTMNNLGSQPIHWACCNGHIGAVDILLNNDVSIDTGDNKGCSPLIIAAQFGRTSLAGYLMGRGARLQLVDKEGDNALHWSAFKGHNELVRLLIHSGFNSKQKDNFGQTPLHLACLSGNLQTVVDLVEQDGVELDIEDHNHNKPVKLAEGRKHWDIVSYLDKAIKKQGSILPQVDMSVVLFGPPGKSKLPMLVILVSILLIGYPTYVVKLLPATAYSLQTLHLIFVFFQILMWTFLVKVHSTDPGALDRNTEEYEHAIRQMAFYDAWRQNEGGYNPLNRLCHTCRLVKPPRTKHCKITNRCVRHFDHYCPYVYNTIGFRNRHYFAGFVSSAFTVAIIGHYVSWVFHTNLVKEHDYWIIFCNLFLGFFTFLTGVLMVMTWYQASINMTTNERANYHRYEYLKDSNGRFFNPYDKSTMGNIKEFLHLSKAPDEVQVLQKGVDCDVQHV